ncbi:MAG: cytochrome P450 [Dermatophilus congolensis]|nr:cytochrome P450 [Dermatophilus congolensis]
MSGPIPDWEPLSDTAQADQVATYDAHREACPVARSPRGVTVFRHADVVAVAADPLTFSSGASEFRQVPNTLDPPEHAAYRAVIDPFFSADRMAALEPEIRRIARNLLADLAHLREPSTAPSVGDSGGATVDAVHDIGYPFAVRATATWLGWEGSEARLLTWMGDNHAATRSADRTRTAAVAAAFDAIVSDQVQRRRSLGADASDDPTTELTRLTVEGRPLTDDEIVSVLRNWTAGDLGSIAACIGVVAHHLAAHPDLQSELREDPTRLAGPIDEILRIDNPFLVNRRVTTRVADIAGHTVEAGARVYLNWTAANRDPRVFGDPDDYRPRENAPHNLVYGTGIHICPGRPLATMELVSMTRELLAATTSFTLDADRPARRETYPVGGWAEVPLRLVGR